MTLRSVHRTGHSNMGIFLQHIKELLYELCYISSCVILLKDHGWYNNFHSQIIELILNHIDIRLAVQSTENKLYFCFPVVPNANPNHYKGSSCLDTTQNPFVFL